MNVLVYAYRADAPRHLEYHQWLTTASDAPEVIALSPVVLSGFLRVVTHPKIYRRPSSMDDALAFVAALRDRSAAALLTPGPAHWTIFERLCRESDARGNLITDAYLAALAVEVGAEVVTTDRDFARFPALRWRHPLAAAE